MFTTPKLLTSLLVLVGIKNAVSMGLSPNAHQGTEIQPTLAGAKVSEKSECSAVSCYAIEFEFSLDLKEGGEGDCGGALLNSPSTQSDLKDLLANRALPAHPPGEGTPQQDCCLPPTVDATFLASQEEDASVTIRGHAITADWTTSESVTRFCGGQGLTPGEGNIWLEQFYSTITSKLPECNGARARIIPRTCGANNVDGVGNTVPVPPIGVYPTLECDQDEWRCEVCATSGAFVLHPGTNCALASNSGKGECAATAGCAGKQWQRCRGVCEPNPELFLPCNQFGFRCEVCGTSTAYAIGDGTNCAQQPWKGECAAEHGCDGRQWKACKGYCPQAL